MKKLDYKSIISRSKKYIISHGLMLSGLVIIFCYAFLVIQIVIYRNAPADKTMEPSKAVRIDKSTVDKLNNLQDNSVQVQAIFNDARNNPF